MHAAQLTPDACGGLGVIGNEHGPIRVDMYHFS
jgi:hypothetical protein